MCGLPRYLTTANVKDIVDAFLPFCAQSQPTRYPSISSALRPIQFFPSHSRLQEPDRDSFGCANHDANVGPHS